MTTQNKPLCFIVYSDEIEDRLDPKFYQFKNPFFKSKFSITNLENYFFVNPNFEKEKIYKLKSDIISFVPMKNIDENLKEISVYEKINISKDKGYTPIQKRDFLFAKVTPCMENGNMAICKNMPFDIGLATTEVYVFREKEREKISNEFLKCLFEIDNFRKFAKNSFTGTGGLQRIPRVFFSSLQIPIPPKEIQQKIISLMDDAYSLKKQNESQAENLIKSIDDYLLEKLEIIIPELKEEMCFYVSSEEVKNKRMDTEFHQKKYKQIEEALENGKYELNEIKELDILNKIENMKNYEEINYIDLSSIDKDFGSIQKEKIKEISQENFPSRARQKINHGDLIISGLSGSLKSIATLEIKEDKNFICSTGFYVIKNSKDYDNHFLFSFFRNKYIQILLNKFTSGAIMSAIPINDFLNFKIPLPPLQVQKEIATEVQQRLNKAKELKQQAKENLEKAKKEVENILLSR